ncbi:hypothetical protein TTRE_0000516901 [Trichuris trichiura]|uniref:Uncharacterized protein n=1 Tax=Trichuris trichiura TaxID=36087 RepID=A0A077Z9I5_TRITR|nr:hypothetical protein TTRE_0000516901 [Trichuris trichiura]
MSPRWFELKNVPFHQMWPDDQIWWPYFLRNQKFQAYFLYDHLQEKLIRHEITVDISVNIKGRALGVSVSLNKVVSVRRSIFAGAFGIVRLAGASSIIIVVAAPFGEERISADQSCCICAYPSSCTGCAIENFAIDWSLAISVSGTALERLARSTYRKD